MFDLEQSVSKEEDVHGHLYGLFDGLQNAFASFYSPGALGTIDEAGNVSKLSKQGRTVQQVPQHPGHPADVKLQLCSAPSSPVIAGKIYYADVNSYRHKLLAPGNQPIMSVGLARYPPPPPPPPPPKKAMAEPAAALPAVATTKPSSWLVPVDQPVQAPLSPLAAGTAAPAFLQAAQTPPKPVLQQNGLQSELLLNGEAVAAPSSPWQQAVGCSPTTQQQHETLLQLLNEKEARLKTLTEQNKYAAWLVTQHKAEAARLSVLATDLAAQEKQQRVTAVQQAELQADLAVKLEDLRTNSELVEKEKIRILQASAELEQQAKVLDLVKTMKLLLASPAACTAAAAAAKTGCQFCLERLSKEPTLPHNENDEQQRQCNDQLHQGHEQNALLVKGQPSTMADVVKASLFSFNAWGPKDNVHAEHKASALSIIPPTTEAFSKLNIKQQQGHAAPGSPVHHLKGRCASSVLSGQLSEVSDKVTAMSASGKVKIKPAGAIKVLVRAQKQ